jgi:hypothetical protein
MVLYIQAAVGPTIAGVGVGLIAMARVMAESHPDVFVAVSVMEPDAVLFHLTLMAVPVLEVMVPPVTTHE